MKKFVSLFLALLTVFSCFSISVLADNNDAVYLDDGYYIIFGALEQNVVPQPNSTNETRVISAKRTGYLYNSEDELMASVTLNGTFQYDGTSAEATKATYNYHVYADDWRFGSGRSYCDGSKAIAEVQFNPINENPKVLVVSMTCSPTGQLS